MNEIDYFQRRCADHRRLARHATSLPVIRVHLAFVQAYRDRIAQLSPREAAEIPPVACDAA